MNKMNWYLRSGLLISSIVIGFNHFIELPGIIHGFVLGTAVALELVGIYLLRHDMTKTKNFKKNFFSKFIKTA